MSNAKHAAQWTSTLATYAYPRLGKLDVRSIDTQQVLGVLKPIWPEKPETASRVRQRIEAVLDFAASRGLRQGENPARWRGHLQHLLAKPSSIRSVAHHAALDWRRMPEFMDALSSRGGASANALAFAILTAARSGEVRGMRWGEIDLDGKVWTVSAERMKGGKEHRVPLTDAAIRCLGAQGHANALVFPSPSRPDKPLSDMTLTAVIRKMAFGEITVHGFRSTFHDWARADHPSSRQSRFHPIC